MYLNYVLIAPTSFVSTEDVFVFIENLLVVILIQNPSLKCRNVICTK